MSFSAAEDELLSEMGPATGLHEDEEDFHSISTVESDARTFHDCVSSDESDQNEEFMQLDSYDEEVQSFNYKAKDFNIDLGLAPPHATDDDMISRYILLINSDCDDQDLYYNAKLLVASRAKWWINPHSSIHVPEHLSCPICGNLLSEAVVLLPTGMTYDKACIREWFELGFRRCPMTKAYIWEYDGGVATFCDNSFANSTVLNWTRTQELFPPTLFETITHPDITEEDRSVFQNLKNNIFSSSLPDQKDGLTTLGQLLRGDRSASFGGLISEDPQTIFKLLMILLKATNQFDPVLEIVLLNILLACSMTSKRLRDLMAENQLTVPLLKLSECNVVECSRIMLSQLQQTFPAKEDRSGLKYVDDCSQQVCRLLRGSYAKFWQHINAFFSKTDEIPEKTLREQVRQISVCVVVDGLVKVLGDLDLLWSLVNSVNPGDDYLTVMAAEADGKLKEIADFFLDRMSGIDALISASK